MAAAAAAAAMCLCMCEPPVLVNDDVAELEVVDEPFDFALLPPPPDVVDTAAVVVAVVTFLADEELLLLLLDDDDDVCSVMSAAKCRRLCMSLRSESRKDSDILPTGLFTSPRLELLVGVVEMVLL